MADTTKDALKALKENESSVSMILGVVVVLIVGLLLFNYFRSSKPTPEISEQSQSDEIATGSGEISYETEDGKAVPANLPTEYEVVAGDDLWHIAQKYYGSGYNWSDIAKANDLQNANVLRKGSRLTIPRVAVLLSNGERQSIDAANQATNDTTNELTKAQSSEEKEVSVVVGEEESVSEQPVQAEEKTISSNGSYTVVRGDNLWNIALKQYNDGYRWVEIYQANKDAIENPGLIHAGLELRLP